MTHAPQEPIRTVEQARAIAERALERTTPGCTVPLTPHVLRLLLDALTPKETTP